MPLDAGDLFRTVVTGRGRSAIVGLAMAALAVRRARLPWRDPGSTHDGGYARRYCLVSLNWFRALPLVRGLAQPGRTG